MSLTLDVAAFVAKAKKNPETVMRQVSFKLFRGIIKEWPVAEIDGGRSRMNWQASGSTPIRTEISGKDPTGDKAVEAMSNYIMNAKDWTEFTFANNVPYAVTIEYGGYPGGGPNTVGGYSKQAPGGVVRKQILNYNKYIAEEAVKVK